MMEISKFTVKKKEERPMVPRYMRLPERWNAWSGIRGTQVPAQWGMQCLSSCSVTPTTTLCCPEYISNIYPM